MRCSNCGMENVDKAIFCERCGTRQSLPAIETQSEILNVGKEMILGVVPRVALIPLLGLIIGACAAVSYAIGFVSLANDGSNSDFGLFDNSWTSGSGVFFIVAVVLGVIAAIVFWFW